MYSRHFVIGKVKSDESKVLTMHLEAPEQTIADDVYKVYPFLRVISLNAESSRLCLCRCGLNGV